MTMQEQDMPLTSQDHGHFEDFLGHVLDDYKNDRVTKRSAVRGLAHVIAALDAGCYDEAREWLKAGRKFIQQDFGE